MDQKQDTLARLPIFARLAPRSMDAVSTLARIVSAPAGTILVQEGDPSESFFVIASGTVRNGRARSTRWTNWSTLRALPPPNRSPRSGFRAGANLRSASGQGGALAEDGPDALGDLFGGRGVGVRNICYTLGAFGDLFWRIVPPAGQS